MKWSDLQIFAAVARTGSFNAAAQELGVTQPTISRSIKKLELEFNISLFNKYQSGAEITSYGERLLDDVLAMETNASAIQNSVKMANKPLGGHVSLQGTPGLLYHWIIENLDLLTERHPKINMMFLVTDSPEARSVKTDFRISYILPENSELKVAKIGTLHSVPYASEAYFKEYGVPETLADLKQHRTVDHVVSPKDDTFPQHTLLRGRTNIVHSSNDGTIQAKLVSQGRGIGVLAAGAHRLYPNILTVPIEELRASSPLYLSYRPELEVSPIARAVIRWIRYIFKEQYSPYFEDVLNEEDLPQYQPK